MSGQGRPMPAGRPSSGKAAGPSLAALVLLVYLGFLAYPFGRLGAPLSVAGPAVAIPAMTALYLWHGLRAAGPAMLATFAAVAMVVAGSAEATSLAVGFPFGRFAYTERMHATLFGVPAIVLAAYAIVGYWCWRTAAILTGKGAPGGTGQVLAATALMVAWSVLADPVRATIEQRWIWPDGGPLLGVPLSNLGGWIVTSLSIFAAYSVVERRFAGGGRELPRGLAVCPPLMYGALAFEYLVHPLVPAADRVVTAGNAAYSSDAIYAVVAVLALFTMVPAATAAAIIAFRAAMPRRNPARGPQPRRSGRGRASRRPA
jgi:uncharacterized membrane protein